MRYTWTYTLEQKARDLEIEPEPGESWRQLAERDMDDLSPFDVDAACVVSVEFDAGDPDPDEPAEKP